MGPQVTCRDSVSTSSTTPLAGEKRGCKRAKQKHKGHYYAPRRLNLRVNVLPQPGTGHWNTASFFLLVALAACVAVVVTCCFSTWRIGGRRIDRYWPPSSGPPPSESSGDGLFRSACGPAAPAAVLLCPAAIKAKARGSFVAVGPMSTSSSSMFS